ncbi:MAG: formate dehydrogenase subunit gamma [Gammaproteobacteria bacterium]|nr:formate dehydrogenase subunit gamma [Gammaproteobacteria bacterium]MCY4226120.1 formate dehydrogenase subunit gamma [Gammaproteobacteria bacterium]
MSSNTATANAEKSRRRFKAMGWSILLIFACAIILPATSYLIPTETAQAQVVDDKNQRANFWRAVREGGSGYSSVKGPETGVFIQNGGQNWRQLRNGPISTYGGWALILAVLGCIGFYLVRGKIKIDAEISGRKVQRWETWERFMHWFTAAGFVVLAITGLSMLFGRLVLIPVLGPEGFSLWANMSINVHNVVGPFFSIGVLAMFLFWAKNNLFNAVDMKWFSSGGGIIGSAHPSAGKLNGGEKVWFWVVILVGLIAVCGSGFALIGWLAQLGIGDETRATMQFMHKVHAIGAILWIVMFFGHAYIGTVGTEGALEGMATGKVSAEWAKQHHDLWYDEVKDKAVQDEPAAAGPGVSQPSTSTT